MENKKRHFVLEQQVNICCNLNDCRSVITAIAIVLTY